MTYHIVNLLQNCEDYQIISFTLNDPEQSLKFYYLRGGHFGGKETWWKLNMADIIW